MQVSGETTISGDGDSTLVQQTAAVTLKATNRENLGCAGKSPTSVTLLRFQAGEDGESGSLVPVEETEAMLRIATVPSNSRSRAKSLFSRHDGIVQVDVYFASIAAHASAYSFYLRFGFDFGAANSTLIGPLTKALPANLAKTAGFVSSLTTIQAPPELLVVKEPFTLGLQLRNPEGSTEELMRLANAGEGMEVMICQVPLFELYANVNSGVLSAQIYFRTIFLFSSYFHNIFISLAAER